MPLQGHRQDSTTGSRQCPDQWREVAGFITGAWEFAPLVVELDDTQATLRIHGEVRVSSIS